MLTRAWACGARPPAPPAVPSIPVIPLPDLARARLQRQHTHPSATRHPRLPIPTHHTLTCCAPHAHPLLPTAMAFVPYGLVLAQVQRPASATRGNIYTAPRDISAHLHQGPEPRPTPPLPFIPKRPAGPDYCYFAILHGDSKPR